MTNIYLVTQSVNRGYDTYDSFVCVAKTLQEASKMLPSKYPEEWAKSEEVTVYKVGTNTQSNKQSRIILASYNAG